MGLKILHSADWHLDSPFAGFTEEQRQLLKEEQRRIPGKGFLEGVQFLFGKIHNDSGM